MTGVRHVTRSRARPGGRLGNEEGVLAFRERKPPWLKVKAPGGPGYRRIQALMRDKGLHTVCEEANCPNIGECWERGTATFMILGDVCTRRCGFCNVKSGVSTSTAHDGARARIARIVAANIPAPPSGRSSRSTEVTTQWRSSICSTAFATRSGSARSSRSGTPDFTLQKPQRRVQTSPRIMKVAVPRSQHSPMLGQFASSQTV